MNIVQLKFRFPEKYTSTQTSLLRTNMCRLSIKCTILIRNNIRLHSTLLRLNETTFDEFFSKTDHFWTICWAFRGHFRPTNYDFSWLKSTPEGTMEPFYFLHFFRTRSGWLKEGHFRAVFPFTPTQWFIHKPRIPGPEKFVGNS